MLRETSWGAASTTDLQTTLTRSAGRRSPSSLSSLSSIKSEPVPTTSTGPSGELPPQNSTRFACFRTSFGSCRQQLSDKEPIAIDRRRRGSRLTWTGAHHPRPIVAELLELWRNLRWNLFRQVMVSNASTSAPEVSSSVCAGGDRSGSKARPLRSRRGARRPPGRWAQPSPRPRLLRPRRTGRTRARSSRQRRRD